MGILACDFIDLLGSDFFCGVPDSKLRPFCDALMTRYGVDPTHHIIAANEGNACAIAAGYHLATGKIPVVYLQNSGEGNIINPLASLLHPDVYGIPVLFVIGWRGEPDLHDEPQHMVQGAVTLSLLDEFGVAHAIVDTETDETRLADILRAWKPLFVQGKSAAFIVRKGGLVANEKRSYANDHTLLREDALREILRHSGNDPIVCTTGKSSREIFELREKNGESHDRDFLTVGSMGHASSIALGIALHSPQKRVWCIDGDGAVLMHMGAMAVIAAHAPKTFTHVVINNAAHESVGGLPTVAGSFTFTSIAVSLGYRYTRRVYDLEGLSSALNELDSCEGPSLLEICCKMGSRKDLGRPTISPQFSKKAFMGHVQG